MKGASSTLRALAVGADRALTLFETTFIGAGLAFCAVLLFVNVVLRYVFFASLGWAEELAIYIVVWIVFVGAAMAVRTRGHIAVDLLPLALSPENRRRLQFVALALMLVFLAVFFYYSTQHVLRVRALGQMMPALRAPMWLAYLAMPVGTALMFVRTVQLLATVVRERPKESPDGPDPLD